MAEQIARHVIGQRCLAWSAQSAGLYAVSGLPMAAHAKAALEKLGIHPEPHVSAQITEQMVADADLILTMTSSHAWDLRAGFPAAFDKIHELGVYATTDTNSLSASCDIVDPFGGSLEHYTECANVLKSFVESAVEKLARMEAEGRRQE